MRDSFWMILLSTAASISILIIAITFSVRLYKGSQLDQFQNEAVALEYAEWVRDDNGQAVFHWKRVAEKR